MEKEGTQLAPSLDGILRRSTYYIIGSFMVVIAVIAWIIEIVNGSNDYKPNYYTGVWMGIFWMLTSFFNFLIWASPKKFDFVIFLIANVCGNIISGFVIGGCIGVGIATRDRNAGVNLAQVFIFVGAIGMIVSIIPVGISIYLRKKNMVI